MSITINWDNDEKTILHVTFSAIWSINELKQGFNEAFVSITQVKHPVHVIVDMRGSRMLPSNLLSSWRGMPRQFPSNDGMLIFVGTSTLFRAVSSVIVSLYHKSDSAPYVLVETIEEAHALLARVQPAISDNVVI